MIVHCLQNNGSMNSVVRITHDREGLFTVAISYFQLVFLYQQLQLTAPGNSVINDKIKYRVIVSQAVEDNMEKHLPISKMIKKVIRLGLF